MMSETTTKSFVDANVGEEKGLRRRGIKTSCSLSATNQTRKSSNNGDVMNLAFRLRKKIRNDGSVHPSTTLPSSSLQQDSKGKKEIGLKKSQRKRSHSDTPHSKHTKPASPTFSILEYCVEKMDKHGQHISMNDVNKDDGSFELTLAPPPPLHPRRKQRARALTDAPRSNFDIGNRSTFSCESMDAHSTTSSNISERRQQQKCFKMNFGRVANNSNSTSLNEVGKKDVNEEEDVKYRALRKIVMSKRKENQYVNTAFHSSSFSQPQPHRRGRSRAVSAPSEPIIKQGENKDYPPAPARINNYEKEPTALHIVDNQADVSTKGVSKLLHKFFPFKMKRNKSDSSKNYKGRTPNNIGNNNHSGNQHTMNSCSSTDSNSQNVMRKMTESVDKKEGEYKEKLKGDVIENTRNSLNRNVDISEHDDGYESRHSVDDDLELCIGKTTSNTTTASSSSSKIGVVNNYNDNSMPHEQSATGNVSINVQSKKIVQVDEKGVVLSSTMKYQFDI
eukprot:m.97633 g.97633  ORF g.97633 m.97633 type:complete len:504 (-) comp12498_c0_seq1:423-1934(-)